MLLLPLALLASAHGSAMCRGYGDRAGRRLYDMVARGLFAPERVHSIRRQLADGDFDEFNKLFENAVFTLPDVEFPVDVFGVDLDIDLYETECSGIRVGDIQFSYTRESNQKLLFRVEVTGLNLDCKTKYTYKFPFFPEGKGSADMTTINNSVKTVLAFTSDDFNTGPPNGSTVEDCEMTVNVDELTFDGNIFTRAANLFKDGIANKIEEEVEAIACDELGSLGTTLIGDVLEFVGDFVAPHLEELPSNVTDPLFLEKNIEVPDEVDLYEFNTTNTTLGQWITDAIDAANNILGSTVDDPASPTGNGESLFINKFIRSNLLDDDRGLLLDITSLPFVQEGGVVLDVHDNLTQTLISIRNFRVFGLDTFTQFKPLVPIGNYTFQSELNWDYTTVQFDATLDIRPSTLPDSIIKTPGTEQLLENVRVTFGVQDIRTVAAFFVGIDSAVLRTMELGSLMNTSQILSCAFSSLFGFEITGLDVRIGNVQEPQLTNFISPGVNRLISESLKVVLEMYEATLLRSLPSIFQTTVRDILNDDLIKPFLKDQKRECATLAVEEESPIDFRSLFLLPNISESFGGSPDEPYGDLIRILSTAVIDRFLSPSQQSRKLFNIDIPEILDSVLNRFIGNASGVEGLNELLIGPLTKAQSNTTGTLAVDGDLINTEVKIDVGGFQADIAIRIWDARMEHLDTLALPTSLLDPVSGQPYLLDNTATIGSEDRPLRAATKLLIAVKEKDGNALSNEIDIHINMQTVKVVLDFLLKMMDKRVFQTPLGDLTNMDCWIATVAGPTLDEFGIRLDGEEANVMVEELFLSVAKLGVNVSCVSCSSPALSDFAELLSTTVAADAATDSTNVLFETLSNFLKSGFLQLQLDRIIHEANKKCVRSPSYDPKFSSVTYESTPFVREEASTSFLTAIGLSVLVAVVCITVLTFVIKFIVRRRHARWLASLDEDEMEVVRLQQLAREAKDRAIDASSTSMFFSRSIPLVVRWAMPVIIVGNIGFFLSGHLSLGATVNIEASLAGENISVDNFFEFSMAQSAIDIWNAGGKALAFLLILFSGVFPYSKQLATLALWFLPPSLTSSSTRGSALLWLDWLAKWSMIDIFVLVVSIAAFRVTITSPDVAFLPENFYSVDLLVVPMWGLWSNFMAQIISQISSHFIVYYHRKMVDDASKDIEATQSNNEESAPAEDVDLSSSGEKKDDGPSEEKESELSLIKLSDHAFSRVCKPADAKKLVAKPWVNAGLASLGLATVVLVILGCVLPAFSLDVLGAVGVAIESGQGFEEATTNHSIFTVVQLLMDEARFLGTGGAYLGLGALSAVVIFCVLLAPIFQTSLLLYQWFVPLTEAGRMRVYRTNEILQAWQYGEVYLISIFVASWQLGPISEFMINSYCGGLNEFFANMVLYGLLDTADAQCFRVDSRIEPGFFFLTGGTVLLALLGSFVTKATVQFLRESELQPTELSVPTTPLGSEEELSDEPSEKMKIEPVPVLFTDTFKWCLRRQDDETSEAMVNMEEEEEIVVDP